MNEQAPTSLCPGYRYVEKFGDDEEYEEEEEVTYVTLDLGNVEPTLVPSSTEYRLIGLDTPTPYLQLQGTIFKGRHDMLLGTELVFTDNKESQDRAKKPLVHAANIEQRIAFKEVTLVPKGSAQDYNTSANTSKPTKKAAASSKSGGKGRAKGKQKATVAEIDIGNADEEGMVDFPTEEHALQIDRMTGQATEPARPSRKRKSTTVSAGGAGSTKGKERAVEGGRRQTRSRIHKDDDPSPAYSFQPPPLPEMQYSFPEGERQERMDIDMDATAPASRPRPIHEFVIDPALLGPEERERDDMDDMYVDE